MKLKWRNLPAIITLLAGFITCIIAIICKYPLNIMLWILILVMTVFYIIGLSLRMVIIHFLEPKEDESGDGSLDSEDNTVNEASDEQSVTDLREGASENPEEQPVNN